MTIVVHLASLVAEEGLAWVQLLRHKIETKADRTGELIRGIDETIASIVAHGLHGSVASNGAVERRLARGNVHDEPVEVLDEISLTSAAESCRLRGKADPRSGGRRGVDGCRSGRSAQYYQRTQRVDTYVVAEQYRRNLLPECQ